ncbi:hypothetical protein DFS34DRAFT_611174 [Phlyctochytrium arcticum]|nr:hypothetical protein DFS34DRAFT_611174 [Phlyctochytrium arcticum]
MASATPTGAHANLAAGATAATPAPAAKPAVNPSRSLILTDEDMLRLTPTLNWHRRYSGGDLRDGHILSSMNKDDLQTIIRYLNANKRLCIKVSGNKEEVRQRLQSVLFPNSSGYGTPKHSPSPTIPPASALTIIEKETTENQERAWKTLFATFHSEFEFVEEVWSKRFLHPNSTRKQSTLITNLDPTSITRLHELTTTPEHRFLIFLYSDQHRSFLSEGTIRRAFQIKINHARVAHSLYPLVNTQYVDITTYIRIHNPLTKYPLDVAGPTCWWPSGMISIICVRPLTAEKAVVSNCYQTLKELGCDAPYTVPPAGFSAFAQPTLSLGEVTTVLADKLCSMTTPTTAAQDPTQNDDIEIGEQIMSFKCPLTLLRIQVPVKGSQCLHRQCFDALSFFTMTTGPMKTRKCPICAKTLNSNDIKMDLTCARLLAKYPDADKCMILPNGDDKPYDENAKPVRTVLADADLNVSVETSKRKRSEGGDPVRVIDLDSDNDMPFEKRLRLSSPRSGMPSWNGAVIDLD